MGGFRVSVGTMSLPADILPVDFSCVTLVLYIRSSVHGSHGCAWICRSFIHMMFEFDLKMNLVKRESNEWIDLQS